MFSAILYVHSIMNTYTHIRLPPYLSTYLPTYLIPNPTRRGTLVVCVVNSYLRSQQIQIHVFPEGER